VRGDGGKRRADQAGYQEFLQQRKFHRVPFLARFGAIDVDAIIEKSQS
jgi:hypothetical protein